MKTAKIFVGTLYSGENEFEECLASIQGQDYPACEHFVFKNLPNKVAHVTLFKSFLDSSDEFDVLIKVDADMVLASPSLFSAMVKKLEDNPGLDVFSVAVHDFFTDQLIAGLNAYRKTVRWDFEKETIFVDIPEISSEKYAYDDRVLAPAAFHCKNPSLFQAFHYGAHRGLKAIQPKGGSSHWAFIKRLSENFSRQKDSRLGLAVLGAELAYAGKLDKSDLDYTNPRLKHILEAYAGWNVQELEREIFRLRVSHWGFLPNAWRRKMLIWQGAAVR